MRTQGTGQATAPRRRVVGVIVTGVLGATVLGILLRLEHGSGWFTFWSFVLAGVWAGGALASGPLRLGRIGDRAAGRAGDRPVLGPILLGAGLGAVFLAGGLVVRQVGPLADQVRGVLAYADDGSLPLLVLITAVNGCAEELFFRGAVFAALPRRPLVWTTAAYAVATAASGNVMLAFAAVILGVVVGRQREVTGGILAPMLTHVTWSLLMLLALPAVVG